MTDVPASAAIIKDTPAYKAAVKLLERAVTLQHKQEHALAEELLNQVLKLIPDMPDALHLLGTLETQRGNYSKARDYIRKAIAKADKVALFWMNLCSVERHLGNNNAALEAGNKALELEPDNPNAMVSLANAEIVAGNKARVKELLLRALELDPHNAGAYKNLAHFAKGTLNTSHIAPLRQLLAQQDVGDKSRIALLHALAYLEEQNQEYDQAFEHFAEANAIKRRQNSYTTQERRHRAEQLLATDLKMGELRRTGPDEHRCIFIVGMPRSGSTLTEQILAAHPEVVGCGESFAWGETVTAHVEAAQPKDQGAWMAAFKESDLDELAAEYFRRVPPEGGLGDARVIVDKQLFNMQWCGLLLRTFPNARIIHTLRDPMDTCMSCFKQDFSSDLTMTTGLRELGEFYRLHEWQMDQWKQRYPDQIMTMNYEEMVSDQEGQSRRMLEFCGLEWHDDCLAFYKKKSSVATASAEQVRRPVYKTSVGSWQPYEKYLEPLKRALAGKTH